MKKSVKKLSLLTACAAALLQMPNASASPPVPVTTPTGLSIDGSLNNHLYFEIDANASSFTAVTSDKRGSGKEKIRFSVYLPENPIKNASGETPIIVHSHGYTGNSGSVQFLADYWTGDATTPGFIVISPEHTDSPFAVHDAMAVFGTTSPLYEDVQDFRVNDLELAIDWAVNHFDGYYDSVSGLTFEVDDSIIVASGQSFGSSTSSFLAAATPATSVSYTLDSQLSLPTDIKGLINMSGVGPNDDDNFDTNSWDAVLPPFMRISGTYDFSPDTQDPGDRLEAIFSSSGVSGVGDRLAVFIPGATHQNIHDGNIGSQASCNASGGYDSADDQVELDNQVFDISAQATLDFLTIEVLEDPTASYSDAGTDDYIVDETNNIGTNAADLPVQASLNVFGRDGDDTVEGSTSGDALFGSGGVDTLEGGDGEDVLNGGDGADTLEGGNGKDVYINLKGQDTITETESIVKDTVWVRDTDAFDPGSYLMPDKVEILIVKAFAGTDSTMNHFRGNALNNFMISESLNSSQFSGNDGNDQILAGSGDDTVNGNLGEDTLYGGAGDDTINGGADIDTLSGGPGNDTIKGNGGNDVIDGEGFLWIPDPGGAASCVKDPWVGPLFNDDNIDGGAGDDEIAGDLGKDTLTGGGGSDVFIYRSFDDSDGSSNANADIITDFDPATETINLSAMDANMVNGTTDDAADAFVYLGIASSFSGPGQIRLEAYGAADTVVILFGGAGGGVTHNARIVLEGVLPSELDVSNFVR